MSLIFGQPLRLRRYRGAMDAKPYIHHVYQFFQSRFRPARMQTFLECFNPHAHTTILDVGGTPAFWRDSATQLTVTILNTSPQAGDLAPGMTYVQGSATDLPFPDGSFHVVFSNSMIEHLSNWASQEAFAREARRVGDAIWVQTPSRWFPVEPHLLTPFIHYLPKRKQRRLLRNFTLWGLITRPDQSYIDHFLAETVLLSARDMRRLFPGCELHRERVLGVTKSLIAVCRPSNGSDAALPPSSGASYAQPGAKRALDWLVRDHKP